MLACNNYDAFLVREVSTSFAHNPVDKFRDRRYISRKAGPEKSPVRNFTN